MPYPSSLHVIGSKTMGGAERFCFRLVDALGEAGAPVELCVRAGSEVAKEAKGRLPCLEAAMHSVWDPISMLSVRRKIARQRPDVVQTYMGRATRLTRLSRRGGTIHLARLGGYYKLDGYRHAHAWVGNTKGICDYLVRNGFPSRSVFHITNFIELPEAIPPNRLEEIKRQEGISRDAWLLVTAGRFVEVKGHIHLLRAIADLDAEVAGRRVLLLMLGDGRLLQEYQKFVEQAGIGGRVLFLGWRHDPSPFYQMADLVVFPSLEMETLGNVLLEGWAHGKPVLATRFRGAQEMAVHGEDAFLVECGDHRALSEAIVLLLKDQGLRLALAEKGRSKAIRNFSREEITRRYLELYGHLLKMRQTGRL